ncbi:MAG: bifunctional glutamate N-acetyltransferase/amino-acid acetyltransferase ArgJ [Pseudomonadota bacterium]
MVPSLIPPLGFSFSGVHAGIKSYRPDLALVFSEAPCAAAGCFTRNLARAAAVQDAAVRLPASGIRAVVVNSGNANALTGAAGHEAVRRIVAATAQTLRVPASAVLTASTGVIGVPLPTAKIEAALPALARGLGPDPLPAARAILTTDTRVKTSSAELRIGGKTVRLLAIAKGAGMIAPSLATTIAVICTDAAIAPPLLQKALSRAMESTFHALTVDGDMSTNDSVFALASGLARNPPIVDEGEDFESFAEALRVVCRDLVRQIARDGEGATKLVEFRVAGVESDALARELARACAGSPLVKAALFGCDPNWGRILASIGARAASLGARLDPAAAEVRIQGEVVYRQGLVEFDREAVRARLREPEVKVEVELGSGAGSAEAWGCDLSYDYVRINADLAASLTQTPSGGIARIEKLERHTAGFKVSLLLQALGYIRRFAGMRCVVYVGGAAIRHGPPLSVVAEDLLLLRSVGLFPIVVHGIADGGRGESFLEVHRSLVDLLGREDGKAIGIFGEDGALFRGAGEDFTVNRDFLTLLVERGYIPVVAPVGIGEDGTGRALDPDRVAAEVALAVGAPKLVFLSDVPGIRVGGELRSELEAADADELLRSGAVEGGMAKKLRAILRALKGGVRQAHVIDGRPPHGIIAELFTDKGIGTLVKAGGGT